MYTNASQQCEPDESNMVHLVRLTLDPDAFLTVLAEAFERSFEAVERAVNLAHFAPELARIDLDFSAAGLAGHYRVLLKPTDRLLELAAAPGTGDVEGDVTESASP